MTTLIRRNSKFSALQFDGDNRDKVLRFLGVDKQFCQLWRNEDSKVCHLSISAPGLELGQVNVKEWILIGDGKSSYAVITEEVLKREYEEL